MTKHRAYSLLFLSAVIAFPAGSARAAQLGTSAPLQNIGIRPELLRNVGLDQNLNAPIPRDLEFRDEKGNVVPLDQFFGHAPVLLTLVYYDCPMLCTQVLNGVLAALKELPLQIGTDFTVLTISIDPAERPALAAAKHELYAGMYGRPGAQEGWHFLTGDEPQIKRLASAVGFRYAYDPASGQYAHPSGIMVLTPEGKVARYFYGIRYPSRDLRFGLIEASENKIGTLADQVLLFCYRYDSAMGKYSLLVSQVIRAGGLLTVLLLGAFLLIMFRQERYRTPPH